MSVSPTLIWSLYSNVVSWMIRLWSIVLISQRRETIQAPLLRRPKYVVNQNSGILSYGVGAPRRPPCRRHPLALPRPGIGARRVTTVRYVLQKDSPPYGCKIQPVNRTSTPNTVECRREHLRLLPSVDRLQRYRQIDRFVHALLIQINP
jgi:hypothetical protein